MVDVDRSTLEERHSLPNSSQQRNTLTTVNCSPSMVRNDIMTVSTRITCTGPITWLQCDWESAVTPKKPLTRTIYEARLLAKVAKETGVCTQMGNQGTALDSSREAIAQLKSGAFSDFTTSTCLVQQTIWAQGPDRRMTLEKFTKQRSQSRPMMHNR